MAWVTDGDAHLRAKFQTILVLCCTILLSLWTVQAIAEKERVLKAEWGEERASLSAALSNEKGRLELVEGELEDMREAMHEKG
jgi:hypothetical protein